MQQKERCSAVRGYNRAGPVFWSLTANSRVIRAAHAGSYDGELKTVRFAAAPSVTPRCTRVTKRCTQRLDLVCCIKRRPIEPYGRTVERTAVLPEIARSGVVVLVARCSSLPVRRRDQGVTKPATQACSRWSVKYTSWDSFRTLS